MSPDPQPDLHARLQALVQRAEDLRARCPYRFYRMTPEQVPEYLHSHHVPSTLGWAPEDVERLRPLLGLPVPEDYLAYLSRLGHLHPQLFGYDLSPQTPEGYLNLRLDCLDKDLKQWNIPAQSPPFAEIVQSGLFVGELGGFAVWYVLCGSDEPTQVRFWDEGKGEGAGDFHVEGLLLESLEGRMAGFESRVNQRLEWGDLLIYGRGSHLRVGSAIGQELLEMPHKGWRVELTSDQLQRIRDKWPDVEL